MQLTLQQTEKLFKGKEINFNSLGFSMLITRLKVLHAKEPAEHTLENCNVAINSFLGRFKDAIADDYEKIARL